MNNLYKYSLVLLLFVGLSACVDEDKLFDLGNFEKGALLNFTQTANDWGFIDIFDLENTTLEFSMDFSNNLVQDPVTGAQGSGRTTTDLAFAPVSSFDIVVRFRRESGTPIRSSGVLSEGITNWPETQTFKVGDFISAISELNNAADLEVGDEFTVTSTIYLEDGRTLPGFVNDGNGLPVLAYSTSFPGQPGLQVSLVYNVACGSDLASDKVYNVSANITGTCCGLATGVLTGTTTVAEAPGTGKYAIADVLAGHLIPFGLDPEGVVVIDVCNTLTVDPTQVPAGTGLSYMPNSEDPTGSYDPDTDTWVIKWEDAFGNGIRGVSTLTPQ